MQTLAYLTIASQVATPGQCSSIVQGPFSNEIVFVANVVCKVEVGVVGDGQDQPVAEKTTLLSHLQMPEGISHTRSPEQSSLVSQIPDDVNCATHLPLLQTVSSSHSASSIQFFSHVN